MFFNFNQRKELDMPKIRYNPMSQEIVQSIEPTAEVYTIPPEVKRAISDGIAQKTEAFNMAFDLAQARAIASMHEVVIL